MTNARSVTLTFLSGLAFLLMQGPFQPCAAARQKSDLNEKLLIAAENGRLSAFESLVQQGADIHAQDNQGRTPLHLACGFGHLDLVEFLISKGADVNASTESGETPLHQAKSPAIARILIAAGADLEAREAEFGMTPVFNQSLEVIMLLAENGADLEASSRDGLTPLSWSANTGDYQVAKYLIAQGADVNSGAGTAKAPLHYAANLGRVEIAKVLLENGADVNVRDRSGWTPLHWGAFEGGREIALVLIAAGAEKNARTLDKWSMFPAGSTPLDIAEKARSGDMAALLRSLGCKRAEEVRRESYEPASVPTLFETIPEAGGWRAYKHPIELNRDSIEGFKPGQDSPEAAVLTFYSSHIRGDDAYQAVYAPIGGEDGIKDYQKWKEKLTFKEVKLLRKKALDSSRFWISIHMVVEAGNQQESGEDDIEVGRINGKWWIIKAPR